MDLFGGHLLNVITFLPLVGAVVLLPLAPSYWVDRETPCGRLTRRAGGPVFPCSACPRRPARDTGGPDANRARFWAGADRLGRCR